MLDKLKSAEVLKITGYTDKSRKADKAGGLVGAVASMNPFGSGDPNTFEAPVSIEQYSQRLSVKYARKSGINTSAQQAEYISTEPQVVKFQILIDETKVFDTPFGAIADLLGGGESVMEQVDKFMYVCYNFESDIHEPKYLVLTWGPVNLKCRLSCVKVDYTLYDRDGNPLRAMLDAEFIEDIPDEERKKREGKESPDITHTYVVKAGDTLPALARRVYGSPSFYLALATFNGLNHFRVLPAGQEIVLPPSNQLELEAGS